MSRRLNRDYRTKIRNIPRRIKALNRWASTFHNPERSIFSEDEHYWNFKIPVDINIVEGKCSTLKTKADCAQALINACSNLITATAGMNYSPRITAVVCLPVVVDKIWPRHEIFLERLKVRFWHTADS